MGNKQINATTVKLGIYEESNDSQLAGMLGQVKELEDGRKFVLCKNGGTALAAGKLVQTAVNLSASDSLNVAAASAIGDKTVTVDAVTNAEYAASALKDGYLVGAAVAGDIGTFYKIKDNTAMTNGSEATITLYDGLTNAFVADSTQVTICANPLSGVIVDANTAPLVGVPLIAVTANYYFWALFEGYGPAIATAATIAAGNYLEHDAGAVKTYDGDADSDEAPIGVAVTAAAASEALIVKYFNMG